MKIDEKFKQMVYELIRGSWNLQEYPVDECKEITNEFEDGAYCDQAYELIYNANLRLCRRLGKDEDEDVECIIANFFDITKHLCMKMYDYGAYYTEKNQEIDTHMIKEFYASLAEDEKLKFMNALRLYDDGQK